MSLLPLKLLVFSATITLISCSLLRQAQVNHQIQLSSNEDFRYLSTLSDTTYINRVLDSILIPRVVGTENHEKVANYIVRELKKLKWDVNIDKFKDNTPNFGRLTFKNIIATLNPNADRYLVLACHYDSKYFKNDHFVGAVDSAVPCAMMLSIARSMAGDLDSLKQSDLSLKLIFFDGEEAFEQWGPNDSIYGAKHLAKKMENDKYLTKSGEDVNEINKIDILILLDLIGHKNPTFQYSYLETQHYFARLSKIEDELHRMGLLKGHRYRYFQAGRSPGHIEDDHIPFLQRGVPVLHLISAPFPAEWHTSKDNRDLVDLETVNNINLILKVFIAEYFSLSLTGSSSTEQIPGKEL